MANPLEGASGYAALLSRGFTVFSVRHGSGPWFKVPETHDDVRRAVRHVRMHADTHGVDPDRLGVWGGSAGGHLALLLGLDGDDGDPTAEDEVLRTSSRVAAVVAYYPPIDLRLRPTPSTRFPPASPDGLFFPNGIELSAQRFEEIGVGAVYPGLDFDDALRPSVSPILFVSDDDPPTLLVHGDRDLGVDVTNSHRMHADLADVGVKTKLVIIEGAGHGLREPAHVEEAEMARVEWFARHLLDEGR